MLVKHRIDDVDKSFITVKQPVAAGQQIALKPALTLMLTENFHHPAITRQLLIVRLCSFQPGTAGHVEDRRQAVRGSFIRAKQAEIIAVALEQHAEIAAQMLSGLRHLGAWLADIAGKLREFRRIQLTAQQAAIGIRR